MWSSLSKRGIAGLAAVMMLVANVIMPAQAAFAESPVGGVEIQSVDDTHKYTICHSTNSATNPYNAIEVDYNSIIKDKGHHSHGGDRVAQTVAMAQEMKDDKEDWGDIIPAIPEHSYPGKNLEYGQSILDNDCSVPSGEVQIPEVTPVDPCNPRGVQVNAYWELPADTTEISWMINGDNELIAMTNPGYVFDDDTTSHNYGVAPDSGEVCPPESITIPVSLTSSDPCGLDNASLVTDSLDSIENISYEVNDDGSVSVMADDGYVLDVNGTSTYVYDAPIDSGELCEVLSEEPEFVDNCGTQNDYYIVQETDKIAYSVDGEVVVAGKYYVDDASEVTVMAKVTDDDYEIANDDSYSYQFTDEACSAGVDLEADAWCYGADTVVEAVLTNDTDSWQAYQVVISDAAGEVASEVVVLQPGQDKTIQKMVAGDGEFTVSVYSYNGSERGELLSEQIVETECIDDFTPMIYKKNQDGKILSSGKFTVEVCQWLESINASRVVDEEDPCDTYEDVYFGTDGQWFVDNVEYKMNVYTEVTITEAVAPQGCQPAGPWKFIWKRNTDGEVRAFLSDGNSLGSWDTADGSNVFNLVNECDEPGQGGETPTPTTPEPTEPTLADTGTSQNFLLAVAGTMMLASVGFAVSPKLLRRN